MSGQQSAGNAAWFDGILAERQVYVRGRGRPHFVTITRRQRVLRAAALLGLIVALAGVTAGLVRSLQQNGILARELQALQASTAQAGGEEAARLRQALGEERAARERAEAELAQEREAAAVAMRSRAAELEAAQAKATLLGSQLASAEEARVRLAAELAAATAEPELARLREQLSSAEKQRVQAAAELEAVRAGLAVAEGKAAALQRAEGELASLRGELDRATGRIAELEPALAAAQAEVMALRGEREALAQRAAVATPIAALARPEPGSDVRAELAAALARLKELETFVGRRAPAPPALAPR